MELEALQRLQVGLLWADLVLLLVAGFIAWRRRKAALADAPALALILALGFILRLFFSPWAVIHENAHGYEFLRSAFSLEGYFYHGAGYYAFHHLLAAVFGQRPEVVFATNAVLGSLGALLLFPLGKRLLGSRTAAWVAAIGYACWPPAVRIGGSECFFPLAIFFALLSWWAWLAAWESGGPLRFILAAATLAFAVQTRPEMTLWPVVLLLSLPMCRGWTRHLRSPWPYLAAGLLLGLCSGWLTFRIGVGAQEGVPGFVRSGAAGFLQALVSGQNLLLRFDWVPEVLWPLAGLGLMVLAWLRPRALPALLLGFLVLALPVLGIDSGEASSIRLQSPLHPFVLLWGGMGASWLADRFGQRWRVAAAVSFGALLLASSLLRMPQAHHRDNPQMEYAFLKRAVPALPPTCAVITADRFMANRILSTEFPVWWLGDRPLEEMGRFLQDPAILADWPCRLFYRGLSCFTFTGDELAARPRDGIRPECRAIEERFRLVPVQVQRLPNRPDEAFLHVPARTITVGFYRLE